MKWGLCQDCWQQLQDCRWPGGSRSPKCHADGVTSWGRYDGALKRAIAQLKYKHATPLAEPLGLGLADAWLDTQPQARPAVVPIPLHPTKQKQRGFNQTELLADVFCRRLKFPLNKKLLQRTRQTQPQFNLAANERQQNLAGAFSCEPRFKPNCPVLLLDDIYTTGATIAAAQAALEAEGVLVLGAIAVAQTTRNARNQTTNQIHEEIRPRRNQTIEVKPLKRRQRTSGGGI